MSVLPKNNGTERASERNRICSGLAAEVAFALLPLLVVLMVVIHTGHSHRLFSSPEWSFGAAILFGQSLVKFVSGIARGGAAARGPVALFVALLVVFGLVPSLSVLHMTLETVETKTDPARWQQACLASGSTTNPTDQLKAFQAAEASTEPATWLQASQVVLFLLASLMYMLLGLIGETWSARPPSGALPNPQG
jgi:hypothetical protein